ncbi:unnamed protein product [Eruca vesicaria subsp. sativa]|uniref:Uncharacterized protein n=1 Tax=Eruca vesicaria subsp. sativa TaxID=29727 RepID=A0ABC8JBS8_ERUVS|nr:unnamed protein product [Eruca vesicaria subsp. sativa]
MLSTSTPRVLRTTQATASPALKAKPLLVASSSSCGAPEREPAASVDACLSHFGESLTEPASNYSLDG